MSKRGKPTKKKPRIAKRRLTAKQKQQMDADVKMLGKKLARMTDAQIDQIIRDTAATPEELSIELRRMRRKCGGLTAQHNREVESLKSEIRSSNDKATTWERIARAAQTDARRERSKWELMVSDIDWLHMKAEEVVAYIRQMKEFDGPRPEAVKARNA